MEAKDTALDAQDLEVCEVVSVEPVAEASVKTLAEAVPGVAVAVDTGVGAGSEISPQQDYPPHEEVPPHRNGKLKHVIECMLFVSSEPLTAGQIAQTLDLETGRVEDALAALEDDLDCGHGLQLMRVAGAYQICTRPEFGNYCEMILQPSKKKLSKAALETLAVVAYRQPCTMPEIEAVRGVSVDGVIKTLTERGLVKEAGRKQAPGRPILYATTEEFLEYFGLNNISELPDIDMLAVEEVKALEAERDQHLAGAGPQASSEESEPAEPAAV